MNPKLFDWMLGLLTLIAVSVAGWAIQSAIAANTKIALIQQRLDAANTLVDDAQNERIKANAAQIEKTEVSLNLLLKNGSARFWRDRAWSHKQINLLRVKAGLGPADDEPDLSQ